MGGRHSVSDNRMAHNPFPKPLPAMGTADVLFQANKERHQFALSSGRLLHNYAR